MLQMLVSDFVFFNLITADHGRTDEKLSDHGWVPLSKILDLRGKTFF